jgi:chromate reductase, NAD(P)H dehydrogenase (quinone)
MTVSAIPTVSDSDPVPARAAVRVLVFAGSLRAASLNKKLARIAAGLVQEAGAEATFIDLKDFPLPVYDGDLESASGLPPNARKLKDLFIAHDAFVIACPEYNAGVTGALKNAIDWVSRQDGDESGVLPYEGKVVGLCSAAGGVLFGIRAMEMLRGILMNLGCLVVPKRLGVPRANQAFDASDRLTDPAQVATLTATVQQVVRVAAALRAGV